MYHPHKHGVLDHACLSVFLRVGGKSGRAEGPTLILILLSMDFILKKVIMIFFHSYLEKVIQCYQKGITLL